MRVLSSENLKTYSYTFLRTHNGTAKAKIVKNFLAFLDNLFTNNYPCTFL
nr:MAG TPA: hypothetical protein [Caudoviricetes sp.]